MSGLPPGFELDPPPKAKQPVSPVAPAGTPYTVTGKVVDGDTFGLTNGSNARLYGVDAFETGQPGFRPDGTRVDLGSLSLGALASYLRPSQPAYGTGKQTYGRPVVTLGNGPTDPVRQSLLSGTALAAPNYLTADPDRRARYMEDERLSRLNRQGAHQTQYMTPDAYRSAKRWGLKLRPDEEMVWTNDLPELRPEFQRLSDAEEQDYFRFLASRSGDQNFGQGDLDAYWKGKGRIAQQADPKFLAAVRKGERLGALDYSSWDAATLADFKKQNAFAGMRPEVQDAYGSILSDPNSNADTLAQFANVNGMTFDPRDVSAYFAARAKGETAPIPLPIINPGDGRSGAFGRGLADPFGFLDEAGGAVDAVAPQWLQGAVGGPTNRETIWNSDRSFGDIYENNTRQNRAIIDYDETYHPWWRLGGQATSGFALPYGGGVRSLSGLAKMGAAEGAVYGFGSRDGTLAQRLANVPANATIGALAAPATGAIINKGGEVLFPALQAAAQRFARTRNGATDALAAPSAGGARDAAGLPDGFMLDEPLTLGQMPARPRDTLNILSSQSGPLPLPALGERVPSAYPGPTADSLGRARDWLDVQAYEALPGGFILDTSQPRISTVGEAVASMNAEGLPSLSSPRLRDVIDVTANQTSRLMDTARTYGLMRQNAARVQPGDVLPRPANEVRSVDEFGRISEGLYPDVRAPNERVNFVESSSNFPVACPKSRKRD